MCSFGTIFLILKIIFCLLPQSNYHNAYYYGGAFVYFIFQMLKLCSNPARGMSELSRLEVFCKRAV